MKKFGIVFSLLLASVVFGDEDDVRIQQRAGTGFKYSELPADQTIDTWAKFLEEAGALSTTGGTATNTILLGSRHTIRAIGNASTAQTISWTDFDTITLTLDSASCEITLNEGANLATGQDRTIAIVVTQDGTGGRALTWAGSTLSVTPQINPRANAVTTLYLTTRNQGTNADVVGPEPLTVQFSVIAPNDLADAVRDACLVWHNDTGRSMYVTKWEFWAGTDNTTLNLETTTDTGATNATVDAVEIATDGTGLFYASDTTITASTITSGSLIFLDFDDTDTPTYVKGTLTLWP